MLARESPSHHRRAVPTYGPLVYAPSRLGLGERRRLGKALERGLHVGLGELEVLELAREVGLVGGHVEVTVPGEVEEDHSLGALVLRLLGLVEDGPDRVSRL